LIKYIHVYNVNQNNNVTDKFTKFLQSQLHTSKYYKHEDK